MPRPRIPLQQALAVVVPGEAAEDAFATALAHGLELITMQGEVLEGGAQAVHVVGFDVEAVVLVDDGVATFGGGDDGKGAGGGFERDLGKAFAFTGEDEGAAGAEFVLESGAEAEVPHMVASIVEVGFDLVVQGAEEDEFGIAEGELFPGFQQVMHAFAFDQGSGENEA